tara:strand:+ start:110 stop:709 length:600 start_codon:yes stop_codon:yes gene_type:complete
MILTGILIIGLGLFIFSDTPFKILGIIIISVGLNFFANYYKLQNIKESNQMTNWKHTLPLKIYEDLKTDFGIPLFRINKENGLAIWKKSHKQKTYDEIILRDEEINNSDDRMEQFCLYLYAKLYIPPKQLAKVLNLSNRISYNKGKFMVLIFTNSVEEGNKILLQITQLVNNNKIKELPKQLILNHKNFKVFLEADRYL